MVKVPAGKNDFDKNWRNRLVAVITEDRVVDASLRAKIEMNNLYICQRHFTEDQYYRHETKVTLNPGVILSLNLPQKSHPSSSTCRWNGGLRLKNYTIGNLYILSTTGPLLSIFTKTKIFHRAVFL